MKNILNSRLGIFFKTYITLVLIFIIQKPIFMLFQWNLSAELHLADWFDVIISGLAMDMSFAGYLMVIPALILIVSVFTTKYLKQILNLYFIIIAICLSLIFVPDLELYSFWGFRIDSTVFTYITSPSLAVASLPIGITILFIFIFLAYAVLLYFLFRKLVVDSFPEKASDSKVKTCIALVALSGLLILPIRGGISTATMNPGRVYYSENMFLNHAALNPSFNLFYSATHSSDFDKKYNFMDDDDARTIFNNLMVHSDTASIEQYLNTDRPNIVFIVLESFGRKIVEPLGGEKGVAPNLNKLIEEGILFENMYANSFRTDRGIVSVIGGYPAQPSMSILKYVQKVQTLNSIPKTLIENGYNASFLYGGDLDFAQMKLFLVTQKITDLTDDKNFPLNQRLTKWGVPDDITFNKFADDVLNEKKEPFIKMFLTLSSHEPFDVPTRKFDHPYLNSVAYTDSCLGIFIDKLKQSPRWENTLVVLVPDHDMRYPDNIDYSSPERHDIFMLWLGGAVKEPKKIDKICSQIDIAPTLLSQMKIKTNDFKFGKDIFNPTYKPFAFYAFPDGFGMITEEGKVVFDNSAKKITLQEGNKSVTDSLEIQGKAFLQCLFDDIRNK